MESKKRKFKRCLEEVVIPEATPKEKWGELLKPIVEYANSIMPPRLFRYRDCSERQFDAFYNDSIYAVNAQMFNDPYDCLIRYDKDYLFNAINQGSSFDTIKKLRDDLNNGGHLPEMWYSLFGEEKYEIIEDIICNASDEFLNERKSIFESNKKEFFNNIDTIFKQAENFLRRNTFIACFSETVKSITMWSHYADSHKGFVLEYDFKNQKSQCDKCDIKDNCNNKVIHYIFPVIYDSKRYDGTSFVESYFGKSIGLYANINDMMFYTKASLHKSPQWQYEKEWRMFLSKNNPMEQSSLHINIRPIAIYYGYGISSINKKILSEMAKEKGLKEYQMYIDTQSDRYSMKYRKI